MIMTPMIMTRAHDESRAELIAYLRTLNQDVMERRSMDLEATILEGLLDCVADQSGLLIEGTGTNITVNDVMTKINERREPEGEEKLSARKIHSVLKTKLNIKVKRIGNKFTVVDDLEYIKRVAEQFGMITEDTPEPGAHDVVEPASPIIVMATPRQGEFLEEPEEPEE